MSFRVFHQCSEGIGGSLHQYKFEGTSKIKYMSYKDICRKYKN